MWELIEHQSSGGGFRDGRGVPTRTAPHSPMGPPRHAWSIPVNTTRSPCSIVGTVAEEQVDAARQHLQVEVVHRRLEFGAESTTIHLTRVRGDAVGVRHLRAGANAKDPDTSYPPIKDVRPLATAPNVLVVLIDDVGFGASSAFGGPCQTPNFEKLASGGLKYTRLHTTALCSPTRQALLTGRNHHSVGMGNITETATAAPGYTSVLPNTKAPLALTLKLNGYSTAQFGKCHEVPVWQTSPAGPFTAWPTGGGGFEYFYGFIGGRTTSGIRRCMRAPPRSSRRRLRRRVITSPRI